MVKGVKQLQRYHAATGAGPWMPPGPRPVPVSSFLARSGPSPQARYPVSFGRRLRAKSLMPDDRARLDEVGLGGFFGRVELCWRRLIFYTGRFGNAHLRHPSPLYTGAGSERGADGSPPVTVRFRSPVLLLALLPGAGSTGWPLG